MDSKVKQLHSRARFLMKKFRQGGGTSCVDEAIMHDREALRLCSPDHPERSRCLTRLASDLRNRYRQLGVTADIEEAITLDREALDICQKGQRDHSTSLINLSTDLSIRYSWLGIMSDLDEAIALNREALSLRPPGRPDRSTPLSNLANHLTTRYQQLGIMPDLDEAVVLGREALGLCPQGHPDRSLPLINLAHCLSNRYKQLRVLADLDEAILLDREALHLRPPGNPGRPRSLDNLAARFSARYEHLGVMADLDEAITLSREALDLCPQGHPDRSRSLINLARSLSSRYQQLWIVSNLDEAIALDREALDLRPEGHPGRSTSLRNLAKHLSSRYKQLGTMSDLDEAIVLDRESLNLRPQGHPGRSRSLDNLASHLRDRFKQSRQSEDKEELFRIYAGLAELGEIVSSSDLSASRAWIRMAESFRHPTLPLAYETSLRLLIQHLATLPSSPQNLDVTRDLVSSLAVDAFASCLHRQDPVRAVELLEQGRCVFWNQLSRLRSPLHDVIASGPTGKKLADQFARLALKIRSAMGSPDEDQHEELCHLKVEMERVVANIRHLPGHSRFLLPSLFSDLRRAACEGPIIIVNASKCGCAALIILLDHNPIPVPLPVDQQGVRDLATELRALSVRATEGNVTKQLAYFLRRIWDQIVSPIIKFLRTTHPTGSRIWWCPTAEFSLLPLHAAGPFRKKEQNLPDLYISSYTPTLTALIRARQCVPSSSERKRFIAIGQTKVAGETELPSVGSELDLIHQLVGGLATFTQIEGEESCTSRVVEEFGKNEWVHLACHGLPNRERPFESAFALSDGRLTIQHITGCESKHSEFAYLSACHTTVGCDKSPDESIHLASAMLFAGFRSVIGTMWAVEDGATKKITPAFYKHMVDESGRLDHTRAGFALNETMRSVNISLDQKVLYIHIGA